MRILAIVFILLISKITAGQTSIHGRIVSESNIPINAATIKLSSTTSKDAVTIANEQGAFHFKELKNKHAYSLEIIAIGYEKKQISFTLTKDTSLSIVLLPFDNNLKAVEVAGGKKMIEITPEKTIINLSSNKAIVGSNIAEALNKIPGVQMTNGAVSFAGKGQVRLMQDGRILQLSEKELVNYLKSIQVANVEKLELISNPSAAYSADGNSGLINIITKKSTHRGYSGSIQAGFKQWQEFPGMDFSGNINYSTQKLNLYANGSMFRHRHKYGFRWEEYYPDRSWIMSDTGDYYWNNLSANVGAEYKITKNSILGVNIGFARYHESGADYVRNTFYNAGNKADSVLTTYATYVPLAKSQTYDLYYKTQLDTSGATFALDGNYLWYYRTDESDFTGKSFLPSGAPIPASTAKYYNNTLQKIDIYALKADWYIPTKLANLKFGGKINFIKTYNDLNYYKVENEDKIYDESLSNEYKYTENTQALYFDAGKTLGKWMFDVGVRAELTQTTGYAYLSKQENKNDYLRSCLKL